MNAPTNEGTRPPSAGELVSDASVNTAREGADATTRQQDSAYTTVAEVAG